MFGSGKIRELETQIRETKNRLEKETKDKLDLSKQLDSAKGKIRDLEESIKDKLELGSKLNAANEKILELEESVKDRLDLSRQLEEAKERIQELEQTLKESEGANLKEQARKTIAEFEGLKELYIQKNKEIDSVRESTEEGFAREAAVKRQDLSDEIQHRKEESQQKVAQTVKTFTGSYQYYLDQIRLLMDALCSAARETGETLFESGDQNLKERFGTRILNHLKSSAESLLPNKGDVRLIGTKEEEAAEAEAKEAVEEAAEEVAEETAAEAEEIAETAGETVEEIAAEAEEIAETAGEAVEEIATEVEEAAETAEEAVEETAEEAEETAETAGEAVEEIVTEAEDTAGDILEEASDTVEEAAEEISDGITQAFHAEEGEI